MKIIQESNEKQLNANVNVFNGKFVSKSLEEIN